MDIKLPNVSLTELPVNKDFMILVKGAEVYVGQRAGHPAKLVLKDGTVDVVPTAVAPGPLLQFLNNQMYGLGVHYAQIADGRDIIDHLERIYPKDASAIDPRTVFTQVTLRLPAPSPAEAV